MRLFPLFWAAKPGGSIPHVSIFINTKSDGQALRVSLVKLVAYLSSSYAINLTRGSPAFFSRGGAPCYPGERSESWITPASADVISGDFFALAKKVTLITVSWMRLLEGRTI